MNVIEQRMPCVGRKYLFISFKMAYQHTGFFKAVELYTDSVGGFTKFNLQVTQIRPCGSIQKKLDQQFNPGLGSNQCIKHQENRCLSQNDDQQQEKLNSETEQK